MRDNNAFQHYQGSLLVALQFALITLLAWLAFPVVMSGKAPIASWACGVIGVLLGVWAISINRWGNFNIRPTPKAGGKLVQQGPYRWIRHPMYTAVMTYSLACAWASASTWAWLATLTLVLVLGAKASLEERWMSQLHPGYAEYRRRTWWFVPWLF